MSDHKNDITYFEELPGEIKKIIIEGLNRNAFNQRGLGKSNGSFSYVAQDASGEFCAGISGFNYYGCLHVDLLYVREDVRNKGYGKRLMLKAEGLARDRKCLFITLNTMDFEARPFYEKLGFQVEFERTGFEKGATMYYLKKDL